ncbi:Helix-turn-helix [Pseudobutyrivibrio ruminis]|uniref:Helix-turn-helix n=1 Tax=Pseudobutyrivibrio ruminis TaxID=46206 RepID=A0A1H7EYN2_9FIRM|nr:helix-turn-helix transcriptional regulator [Pseudobutyrivibrio ruminis]SEK18704.1 Helix-turn-helix [Pseudobutyrivibrio ruminis]
MDIKLKLQKNLKLIRKVGGWTATDFARLVGITRPTLSKIEKSDDLVMTRTQYIAIRKLLDHEIIENKNELLDIVVRVLVDGEDVDEADRKRVEDLIKGAKKGGVDGETIAIAVAGIVGLTVAALLASTTKDWFSNLIDTDK